MARTSRWIHALVAAAMVVVGVVGASSAVSAAPTAASATPTASSVGPPDAPLTQVTTNVSTIGCGTFSIVASVPTSVRAGRPFPVTVTSTDPTTGPGVLVNAELSIAGGTTTGATISLGNTAYFVAPWSPPEPTFRLSITGFEAFEPAELLDRFCSVDSPVELATIPVLHDTPFTAANITATQQFGFYCIAHPSGFINDIEISSVSVTVPNQVHEGESFTISGPASVTGGTRSGDTVTATGKVGDTVDFWYDSSHVVFGPPPFQNIPVITCTQVGGPVYLASVPIVAG